MIERAPRASRSALRDLLTSEAAGGLVLIASAALALVLANSRFATHYFSALHVRIGPIDALHLINDGLMAVFFLLVGLEIKREWIDGELATWSKRVLPGVAAAGGMVIPALVYVAFNNGGPTLRGWAIPTATDIAFALGVLALVGRRAPASLKVFLTALAIVDDLGAVLIIALVYTAELSPTMLAGAAATAAALWALNRAGVERLWPYLALGPVLWFFVFMSGVHATIAGVVLALFIPLRAGVGVHNEPVSPLHRLEHALAPIVAFFVTPIFGFANAGVALNALDSERLADPITVGVGAGLFFGKQLGVFAASAAVVALGWARLPRGAGWLQLYGVSVLCGVGFTMSLFVGLLAFPGQATALDATKIGVLIGSLASALLGAAVLMAAPRWTSRRTA